MHRKMEIILTSTQIVQVKGLNYYPNHYIKTQMLDVQETSVCLFDCHTSPARYLTCFRCQGERVTFSLSIPS
jgi:hypothetical protein